MKNTFSYLIILTLLSNSVFMGCQPEHQSMNNKEDSNLLFTDSTYTRELPQKRLSVKEVKNE